MNVETYDDLCDLIVLEQFKNSVPGHIAIYISEHKVKTAAEAAALADEYVLTHRGDREYRARDDVGYRHEVSMYHTAGKWEERNPCLGKPERALRVRFHLTQTKYVTSAKAGGIGKLIVPQLMVDVGMGGTG